MENVKGNEEKNLRVGDIVIAYHKGYHKITRFERRFYTIHDPDWMRKEAKVGDEYSALVHYQKWNPKTNKFSTKEQSSDIYWVSLAKDHIEKQIQELNLILSHISS
jgi:hypothetical protein